MPIPAGTITTRPAANSSRCTPWGRRPRGRSRAAPAAPPRRPASHRAPGGRPARAGRTGARQVKRDCPAAAVHSAATAGKGRGDECDQPAAGQLHPTAAGHAVDRLNGGPAAGLRPDPAARRPPCGRAPSALDRLGDMTAHGHLTDAEWAGGCRRRVARTQQLKRLPLAPRQLGAATCREGRASVAGAR